MRLARPELLIFPARSSTRRVGNIWDVQCSLRNPVSRQHEHSGAVADTTHTASSKSYGVAGRTKRNMSSVILAYVSWGDVPGLDYLGRAQHTAHKSEEPNEEKRTIQSFLSINACTHSPSPNARGVVELRSPVLALYGGQLRGQSSSSRRTA